MRAIAASAVLAFASITTGSTGFAADRISWGTVPIESSHYAYAVAAASEINKRAPDIVDVTIVSTGGTTDNISRLDRGQIDMALTTWAVVYQAYKGVGPYEGKPHPDIRALWAYDTSLSFYIVREDSGVTDLEGLEGQPWTAGARGTGGEQHAQQTLESLGIKPDYFVASLADALDAVKNGRSIGYAKAGTNASLDASTLELRTLIPIRVLGFTEEQAAEVTRQHPHIAFQKIEEGQIEGVGEILTPQIAVGQIAYPDSVTDEQVAAMIDAAIAGQAQISAAYPGAGLVDVAEDTIESAAALGLPLHSGAVKYFQSKGITVPDSIIPPEMK